jgi:hypothetical protein
MCVQHLIYTDTVAYCLLQVAGMYKLAVNVIL